MYHFNSQRLRHTLSMSNLAQMTYLVHQFRTLMCSLATFKPNTLILSQNNLLSLLVRLRLGTFKPKTFSKTLSLEVKIGLDSKSVTFKQVLSLMPQFSTSSVFIMRHSVSLERASIQVLFT